MVYGSLAKSVYFLSQYHLGWSQSSFFVCSYLMASQYLNFLCILQPSTAFPPKRFCSGSSSMSGWNMAFRLASFLRLTRLQQCQGIPKMIPSVKNNGIRPPQKCSPPPQILFVDKGMLKSILIFCVFKTLNDMYRIG